jgi:hypothetical protein
MKPEHEQRFRRIADDYLDRPGGDYARATACIQLAHGDTDRIIGFVRGTS